MPANGIQLPCDPRLSSFKPSTPSPLVALWLMMFPFMLAKTPFAIGVHMVRTVGPTSKPFLCIRLVAGRDMIAHGLMRCDNDTHVPNAWPIESQEAYRHRSPCLCAPRAVHTVQVLTCITLGHKHRASASLSCLQS